LSISIILSPASRITGGRSTQGPGRVAEVVRISGKDVVRVFGTDNRDARRDGLRRRYRGYRYHMLSDAATYAALLRLRA